VKVSLAAQVMSHTVAASISPLAAAGKDEGNVFYELLYSSMKRWLVVTMGNSFSSYCPKHQTVIKHQCHRYLLLIKPVYQYTSYVKYVTDTNVFMVIKKKEF
jgi:hypothetical protein